MDCSMPGFSVYHQLPEFAPTHVHWVSDAIQRSHPLMSSSPAAFNLSRKQGLFQWFISGGQSIGASALASIQLQSFQWIFRLISFRIDWFDLFAVQIMVWSPTPQFKSINSSVLSFLYGPTLMSIHDYGKNPSFDYMDLCWQHNFSAFNILSRLVIAFLPRSKCLLISWLQSPSAVILEPKK